MQLSNGVQGSEEVSGEVSGHLKGGREGPGEESGGGGEHPGQVKLGSHGLRKLPLTPQTVPGPC